MICCDFLAPLPDHIYVKDTEGRFLLVNESTVRFLGSESMEDVIGKPDSDFLYEQDAIRYQQQEKAVLEDGKLFY